MKKILLMNGPNLNLLGQREPEHYGYETLANVENNCRHLAQSLGFGLETLQSNHEGALVEALHEAGARVKQGELLGVVFNPGAYTHTSVALHDAIKGAEVPVIEIHITNVHTREPFRQHSYVSPAAAGIVIGMGVFGYELAIRGLVKQFA